MQYNLTLSEISDYLVVANIKQTIQAGFATVNIGVSEAGYRFVHISTSREENVLVED